MKLEALFGNTRARWVRYNEYKYREDENGRLFITPVQGATVKDIYNPLKDSDTLVVDGVNAGLACMNEKVDEPARKQAVLDFVNKYGLLGFMTALPTTPDFMDFETVFLPKNQYIEAGTMPRMRYMEQFYPFEKLDMTEDAGGDIDVQWNIENDTQMIALQMTMTGLPMAANMVYHRAYSEPYEWVRGELKDWAFSLLSSIFYYSDKDETIKELYQQGLYAFGGIAPTYHILLEESRPVIVWDFQSLMRVVKMAFSYALTDEDKPLRVCKECNQAYIAASAKQVYCSPKCREKSKEKDKGK